MSSNLIEDEQVGLLRELVKWTKFQGMLKAKEVLESTLRRETDLRIYHLSDGRTSIEIGKAAGVSHVTVTNYWKKWMSLGIVEPIRVQGGTRYQRVFDLGDLGIEMPPPIVPEHQASSVAMEKKNI